MRDAKTIFEEELSGEPLEQDVVIDAINIAQKEAYNEGLDDCIDKIFELLGGEFVVSMKKILKLKHNK